MVHVVRKACERCLPAGEEYAVPIFEAPLETVLVCGVTSGEGESVASALLKWGSPFT